MSPILPTSASPSRKRLRSPPATAGPGAASSCFCRRQMRHSCVPSKGAGKGGVSRVERVTAPKGDRRVGGWLEERGARWGETNRLISRQQMVTGGGEED